MSKKIVAVLIGVGLVLGALGESNATLIDREGGMIYDTDLNITWLQDANYAKTSGYDLDGRMTWNEAVTWVDTLVYGGFSDWRLPIPDPFCNGTGYGYNCTNSEMGHLFYIELGGTANSSILTSGDPDLVLFSNIEVYSYWSTKASTGANTFNFGYLGGVQGGASDNNDLYAWAVRSGDVSAVPEPGAILLLVTGMVGIIGFRKRYNIDWGKNNKINRQLYAARDAEKLPRRP